jgi:hypothetical protein
MSFMSGLNQEVYQVFELSLFLLEFIWTITPLSPGVLCPSLIAFTQDNLFTFSDLNKSRFTIGLRMVKWSERASAWGIPPKKDRVLSSLGIRLSDKLS